MVPSFSTLQLVILLTDHDVSMGLDLYLSEKYSNFGISHRFYSDSAHPDKQILSYGAERLGQLEPEQRYEHMFLDVLERDHHSHDWFVFTYGDTWWHLPNLKKEMKRVEESISPATPSTEFLVVGGGGYLVYSCFLILSRPALEFFSNSTMIDGCRNKLLACSPYEHRTPYEYAHMFALGCHHKGPGTGRSSAAYTATALVNYCAAAPLAMGKCGPSLVGCEWRFGRLTREVANTSVTNALARLRFRQNPKLGRIRLSNQEIMLNVSVECTPAVCDLVGFEHADIATRSWLDEVVLKQELSSCCVR
jgi:hypothetical protein